MLTPARVNPLIPHADERRAVIDAGWRFRLDPGDEGVGQDWHNHGEAIGEPIEVPGSWQGQGFGHDGLDQVWDFRLDCRTLRATYAGTGWYAVTCRAPADWDRERIWLNFGGVHPSAEVWLNGARLGENQLPFVPFGFEVGDHVRREADNDLVVRVHEANRELGFAYSWQGNWSGLYRQVEWRATGSAAITRCLLYPDLLGERIGVRLTVDAQTDATRRCRATVTPWQRPGPELEFETDVTGPETVFTISLPSPDPWSPDAPNLYEVSVTLLEDGVVSDAWTERVGFARLDAEGKHLRINGEPYYWRGSGDFLSCPETGCPDWDRDRWRKKLQALRDYGYNYVRLQSYVYGPEYYDVADEVGLLVQSEMGMLGGWGGHTQWHVYAWPPPTPAHRAALRRQWNLVVERDANHPSANVYCMSNELGDSTHFPRTAWQCDQETKAIKPTALVIYTDGGLNESLPQDFVNAEAARDADTRLPVIQHEFRWWSSFPDARLIERYNGAIRPYAALMAREAARRHGIEHVLEDAVEASQRLQLVEAKGKMEACRRDNSTLAGICHFDAMDANPSPQGIITEFYERKIATAEDWLRANGDTVVLTGLGFDDRVKVSGETVTCDLHVSDFSHPPMQRPTLKWELEVGGQVTCSGTLAVDHAPFRTHPLGDITFTMPEVDRPVRATLRVTLTEGDRDVANAWDLWVLPDVRLDSLSLFVYGAPEHTWLRDLEDARRTDSPRDGDGVLLTEKVDDAVLGFLRRGGSVLLAASEGLVRPFNPKFGFTLGQYYFTPPANYPPYEDGHDGIIVRDHALLGDLPHEGFADLQFFRPIAQSPPLDLEPLGLNDREPVIRAIHSHPVGRSLGYLTEGRVGAGHLVACAMELDPSWPEARYLLAAIRDHLAAGPDASLAPLSTEAIDALVAGTSI